MLGVQYNSEKIDAGDDDDDADDDGDAVVGSSCQLFSWHCCDCVVTSSGGFDVV